MQKQKTKLDFWSIVKILIFAFIALTILYPLSTVLIRSVTNPEGQVTIANFTKFFTTPYYRAVLKNSLFVSAVTTLFCVIIGVFMAYVTTRFDLKTRGLINILVILSLMSPPFIGAYAWIMLFGRSGFITKILLEWFNIVMPTIYGKWGIISVFTFKMFPYVYLFTSGALGSIDSSLEEAAENLGASRMRRLFNVTFPVVVPSVFAGAVMVFMSCISDFGTPMLIGQNYKVLATLVYEQYMSEIGTNANFASAVSMVIVFLCTLILVGQKIYLNRRNYAMTSMRPPQRVHLTKVKRLLVAIPIVLIVLVALLPQIVVVVTSFKNCNGPYFVEGWSLTSYQTIFTRMLRSIKNTYLYSLIAIAVMIVVGSLTAYVTVRKRSFLTGLMDIIMMFPYVIPGAVLGLGFIIAFNRSPFWLAGTAFIMILSYTVRKIPYTVRSGVGFLHQMEASVEEASINLGVPPGRTFLKITVPLMLPGVVSGAILSWIETINELSSSIMLYTGKTAVISVSIYNEVARNSFGTAAAMATILTVTTIIMLIVFNRVSKGRVSIV
ncbi:iron ABC transporter permease [Christensenellaceae bacterium OttesenSCG-928-L17]|nr:iron ABC transporter permease [Christensenellaceae bacterium OttesenSCG-928-L17]